MTEQNKMYISLLFKDKIKFLLYLSIIVLFAEQTATGRFYHTI